jgi:beta-N-acetylhexosaminidase
VDAIVAAMTLRERAARMFMLPVSGTALSAADDARLRALKPGAVMMFAGNFGTPDDVRAFVAAIHATNPELPPLVAVDQEGGWVSRIADDPAPGASVMGLLPAAEIAALARARAETLAGYGFNVNFAPVADIAFTPDSPMVTRSFGSDPATVAACIEAYLAGVAGVNVAHCVKHFPGHGRVAVDSHDGLPVLDVDAATWWEAEALPFQAAIDVGVPMVMLAHLAVPVWDVLPSSLSPVTIRVLREELHFDGVIVTDDLDMAALTGWGPRETLDLAVAAGSDLLLFGDPSVEEELIDRLLVHVHRGIVAPERVAASATRILKLTIR